MGKSFGVSIDKAEYLAMPNLMYSFGWKKSLCKLLIIVQAFESTQSEIYLSQSLLYNIQ